MFDIQTNLRQVETELRIRNYSPKTVASYLHYVREYFAFCEGATFSDSEVTIKNFLLSLERRGASAETRNLCLSAVKFYFRYVLHAATPIAIRTAKRNRSLPVVLSREDIRRLLDVTTNTKHRLMLALAYGTGLRVSEVVALKVQDIDFDEMTIHIKQAKGRKDRISVLPQSIVPELQGFVTGQTGNDLVFGSERGGKLTTRTAQKVFEHALGKAGINKAATFHSLRHSFATHLLENGVDTRYVQALLGHLNIRTTMHYTQVTNPKLKSIRSPL